MAEETNSLFDDFELVDPGNDNPAASFETPPKPSDITHQRPVGEVDDNVIDLDLFELGGTQPAQTDTSSNPDDVTIEAPVNTDKPAPQLSSEIQVTRMIAEAMANRLGIEAPDENFYKEYSTEKFNDYIEDQLSQRVDIEVEALKKGMSADQAAGIDMAKDGVDPRVIQSLTQQKTQIADLRNRELTEAQAKEVVTHAYKMRGYDEKDIPALISTMTNNGELDTKVDESLDLIESKINETIVNERTKAADARKKAEETARKEADSFAEYVDKSEELIPGIKMTNNLKKKVKASMERTVGFDDKNKPLNSFAHKMNKNPQGVKTMLHLLDALGVFNLDAEGQLKPDFSAISSRLTTRRVQQTRNEIPGGGTSQGAYMPDDGFGTADEDTLSVLEGFQSKINQSLGR